MGAQHCTHLRRPDTTLWENFLYDSWRPIFQQDMSTLTTTTTTTPFLKKKKGPIKHAPPLLHMHYYTQTTKTLPKGSLLSLAQAPPHAAYTISSVVYTYNKIVIKKYMNYTYLLSLVVSKAASCCCCFSSRRAFCCLLPVSTPPTYTPACQQMHITSLYTNMAMEEIWRPVLSFVSF